MHLLWWQYTPAFGLEYKLTFLTKKMCLIFLGQMISCVTPHCDIALKLKKIMWENFSREKERAVFSFGIYL